MFIVYVLFVPMVVARIPSDVCTAFNSNLVCLDNGFCSGQSELTCDQAYQFRSLVLLSPSWEDPLTPTMSIREYASSQIMLMRHLESGHKQLPSQFSNNESIKSFMKAISDLESRFDRDHFSLLTDRALINRLIDACCAVSASLATSPSDQSAFRKYFASAARNIHVHFLLVLRWLYALDRMDEMKKALFSNVAIYMQVWMRVHEILGLPTPFSPDGYFEILTEASRYSTGVAQSWKIPLSPSWPTQPLILPVIGDEMPLAIFDHFDITEGTPSWNALAQIRYILEQRSDHGTVRSALFYLRHHPQLTPDEIASFCDETRARWTELFDIFSKMWGRKSYTQSLDFLEVFRLCGRDIVNLETRIVNIKPVIMQRSGTTVRQLVLPADAFREDSFQLSKIMAGIGTIPLITLRYSSVRFVKKTTTGEEAEAEHVKFLRACMRHLIRSPERIERYKLSQIQMLSPNTPYDAVLRGVGVLIAHVVLAGDPKGILRDAIVKQKIPNLYFNSRFVREGFCRVIDCLVMEAVLANDEVASFLDSIRTN